VYTSSKRSGTREACRHVDGTPEISSFRVGWKHINSSKSRDKSLSARHCLSTYTTFSYLRVLKTCKSHHNLKR
jgi:hypothetical protein